MKLVNFCLQVQKWYMRTKGAALVVQKYYRGMVVRVQPLPSPIPELSFPFHRLAWN